MLHEHHPLIGKEIAVRKISPLSIRAAADEARFSLRIDPARAALAAGALGCALPGKIGGVASSNGVTALRLGPDEWYVLASPAQRAAIEARFAELYATTPHSLVDISDREVGIEVERTAALLALTSAIAFDIEVMPVGSGCRTLFDKAQIVLIREAEDRFRIEVWRSFAYHVWGILQAASREVALDI